MPSEDRFCLWFPPSPSLPPSPPLTPGLQLTPQHLQELRVRTGRQHTLDTVTRPRRPPPPEPVLQRRLLAQPLLARALLRTLPAFPGQV